MSNVQALLFGSSRPKTFIINIFCSNYFRGDNRVSILIWLFLSSQIIIYKNTFLYYKQNYKVTWSLAASAIVCKLMCSVASVYDLVTWGLFARSSDIMTRHCLCQKVWRSGFRLSEENSFLSKIKTVNASPKLKLLFSLKRFSPAMVVSRLCRYQPLLHFSRNFK